MGSDLDAALAEDAAAHPTNGTLWRWAGPDGGRCPGGGITDDATGWRPTGEREMTATLVDHAWSGGDRAPVAGPVTPGIERRWPGPSHRV